MMNTRNVFRIRKGFFLEEYGFVANNGKARLI